MELQDTVWSSILDYLGSSALLSYVDVKDLVMERNDRRSVFNVINRMNAQKGYVGEELLLMKPEEY